MANLELIKPTIRAILMALGNRATEREFRGEYFNQEGESFNVVLRDHRLTFYEFMKNLADVCRVSMLGDEVYVQKVSDENSRHMDHLTVVKKKKKLSFRTSGFNPVRSTFSTTGRPYARHFMPPQQPSTKRFIPQPVRAPFVPPPVVKPPATVKLPFVAPKQSYSQYQKEKAKLSTLPPAPHMLAKAIVYSSAQGSKTDDEKASVESKPTTQKNDQQSTPCVENSKPRVENSKPYEDISVENKENMKATSNSFTDAPFDSNPPKIAIPMKNIESNKPCEAISREEKERHEKEAWNHAFLFRSAVNDIKLQKGADLRKQRAPVQAPPLRDLRKDVIVISDDEQPRNLVVITVSDAQKRSVKPQTPSERPALEEQSVNARVAVDSKKPLDNSQEVDKIKQLEAEIQKRKQEIQLLKEALAASKPISKANSVDNSKVLSKSPVPHPKVKELHGIKTFFVMLTEIISPSQFYFQFGDKELHTLTTEMTLFYDNQNGALQVPQRSLAAGQTVAVRDGNHWRRVEIVYISGDDVFVYYIDFGKKRKAKVTEGFSYLTEEFAASTRKAGKGSLYGVQPSEGVLWSTAAIMAFLTKAKGVKILATVKAVTDGTFELSLIYNSIQNATVEDYLLQRRLAQPSQTKQPNMNAILF